ncbi:MAG: hypothetical protein AAB316_10865, partial [Bacteroidota bacterium]
MKRLFFLNLLTIIALLPACQKIDVEPGGGGDPVFTADFTVTFPPDDTLTESWQAGVDSFYMFTGYELGADSVLVFYGELKRGDCDLNVTAPNCGSLKIYIRDFQQLVQGGTDILQALKVGNYELASLPGVDTIWLVVKDTTYNLTFDASPSELPGATPISSQFSWVFANGETASGLQAFFDSVDLDVPSSMNLTVAASNAGCFSSQTQVIRKPGTNSTAAGNCSVQIKADTVSQNVLIANTNGAGPFEFQWSTGDSSQQISIPFNQQNSISVTATSTTTGCSSTASVNFLNNPGTLPQICSAGFTYDAQPVVFQDSVPIAIPSGDSLQLSKVILE